MDHDIENLANSTVAVATVKDKENIDETDLVKIMSSSDHFGNMAQSFSKRFAEVSKQFNDVCIKAKLLIVPDVSNWQNWEGDQVYR